MPHNPVTGRGQIFFVKPNPLVFSMLDQLEQFGPPLLLSRT